MAKFKLTRWIAVSAITTACLFNTAAWSEECDAECSPYNFCGCFELGADLLYWTVCQRDLDFNITEQSVENKPRLKITEKLNVADYGWNCGFRAFAGYCMGPGNWEIRGIFTYFNSDATGSGVLVTAPSEGTSFDVHAKNNLKYRVADALLSREYQLACASILRPFVGFRALWLDQDFNVDLTHLVLEDTITEEIREKFQRLDSNLFAAGIHAGMDWKWELCEGFGIFAGGACSLLQGDMDNTNTFIDVPNAETLPIILKDDECLPVPGYHLNAGFSWETCFDTCGFQNWLLFAISYEFNHWFHVPEFDRSILLRDVLVNNEPLISSTNSSLMLHGVTFSAAWLF